MLSSRESSQPRNQTAFPTSPALAGGFFTTSAWGAQDCLDLALENRPPAVGGSCSLATLSPEDPVHSLLGFSQRPSDPAPETPPHHPPPHQPHTHTPGSVFRHACQPGTLTRACPEVQAAAARHPLCNSHRPASCPVPLSCQLPVQSPRRGPFSSIRGE